MRLAPLHLVTACAVVLLVVAAACGSSGSDGSSPSPAGSAPPVTERQVVDLVDLTCAAVEEDAPATFAAIAAGEAPYVDSDDPALYAFVFDRTVTLVADPDPAFQGRTMRGVPDAAGTCFRDQMVAGAFADGSGWVEYLKERPDAEGLYRKASFYRLVTGSDGGRYVVGAGRYLGPWDGTPAASPSPEPAAPARAEVRAFVDAAWRHAREAGKEQALADFTDPSGEWRRGELYVFAYDMDGVVLALPPSPARIGEDRWDAQDPDGVYFVREFAAAAADPGSGWVRYLYVNPAAGYALQDKDSYVRAVDDTWYVGAGTYAPVMSESSADAHVTEQDVIAFVERAFRHVQNVGREQALADFSDPDGAFRDGELYIFAEDFAGNELASGGQPELVGTNIIDARDANGVYLVKELIGRARDDGRGWVSYVWNNPETGEDQDKRAYVIRAGDDWYVGSGMYVR